MSKSQGTSIGTGIFFCLFVMIFASCGGGGGEGSTSAVDQRHDLAVQATVSFPESSPLDNSSASVLCGGDFSQLDSDNKANIVILTNKMMDVTILLPSRDGVEPPTVYLNTTVVPGEVDVSLNIEETAISLVMTGVDHRFLTDPTMASWVKSVVRRHSADFIDDLSQKMVQDPYLLQPDNIANVLGPLFSQAVVDSDDALRVIYDPDNQISASMQTTGLHNMLLSINETSDDPLYNALDDAIPANAEDFGDFYIKYDRNPPIKGFVFVPPDLLGNSKLTFVNGSMLPVITRIVDTTTREVIKEIPADFMGRAFGPAILSPTNGPFGIPLPTWETIDNGTRSIQLEVFSPGLRDFYDSHYFDADSPSGPLLARASFSGAIMPLLGVVLPSLPSGSTNAVAEVIFGVLQRADVFEKIMFHWTQGEYQEGLAAVYNDITANWGLNTNIVSQIVEELATRGFLKGNIGPSLVAQLGLKVATAKIAVASAGISIAALTQGLVEVPSKVTYQLVYPVGLRDLEPRMMQKLSEGANNIEEFTLTGHGLTGFNFSNEFHTARLHLEAFDKDDESIEEAWLDEDFGFEIQAADNNVMLDTITFKLPDAWVEDDTAIKYVRLTIHHGYIAPGWLGDYTDWTNYLETVQLPVYESSRKKFTIYLTQDVIIDSITPTLLEKAGVLTIRGKGFASDDSGLQNEVYFMDRDNQPVSASIISSSETRITAYVPLDLQLNDNSTLVKQHIGSSSVYVEVSDGSQSNEVWVAVVPDPVTFSPEPIPGEMTYKDTLVALFQINDIPIYYTINDSGEHTYGGPITIRETSEITAYAKVLVDGVYYSSSETTEKYISCMEGETFVPYPHGAKCIVIQNADLMPRRYCPLDKAEYFGPIGTVFGYATCGYSWLFGGVDELSKETHLDKGQTTAFSSTQFWAQPEGRPQFVYRPTASYHFCPDGSFGTACGH